MVDLVSEMILVFFLVVSFGLFLIDQMQMNKRDKRHPFAYVLSKSFY